MKKISRALLKTIDVICVCLLAMVFLSITIQIFCRFTAISLTWTEEFARVCFIIMSYLAAPLCLAEGAHIGIDMITKSLPKGIRRAVEVMVHILICFFCVVFIRSTVVNLGTNVGVSTVTMTWLKMNWIYTAEIVTFVITFIISAIQGILTLANKNSTIELLEKKADTISEEDLGL
ncbi:MAG: TRAP transporter small permease [Oscillospiraceae bacterium]